MDLLDFSERNTKKIINLLQYVRYYCKPHLSKAIASCKALKDIHKGEKCYILGNGPSLKSVDLDKLKDANTVTVNYFPVYNDFCSTYHIMVDNAFFADKKDALEISCSRVKNLITQYDAKKIIGQPSNVYFIYPRLKATGKNTRIRMDKMMTSCVNVVLMAIECAMYMGYSEIYLLGCDFNQFASLRPGHFYSKSSAERTVPMAQDLKYSSRAMYHHYELQSYAENHGIKIYNATPGSLIDAYERVNLDWLAKVTD